MTAKRSARWSARVTAESNALDLEPQVFQSSDPKTIARSLKRSAERSRRRKAEPFRSAMSMLVFYINRAGRNLPRRQRAVLEAAKDELRIAFHRPPRLTDASRRAKSATRASGARPKHGRTRTRSPRSATSRTRHR
jgi:hypothetical protein